MRLNLDRDAVRQALAIPLAVVLAAAVIQVWPLAHGRWLMLGALLLAQVAAKEPLRRRLKLLALAAAASAALSAPFALLGPRPLLFALGLLGLSFAANLLNATGRVDPRTTFFVLLLALLSGGLAGSPADGITAPVQTGPASAGLAVDLPAALLGGGCLAALAAALTHLAIRPIEPRARVAKLLDLLSRRFEPVAALLASSGPDGGPAVLERIQQDLEQSRDQILLLAASDAMDLPAPLDAAGAPDTFLNVRLMRLSRLVAASLDDAAGIDDRQALGRLAPNLAQLAADVQDDMRALVHDLSAPSGSAGEHFPVQQGQPLLTDPSLLARDLPFSQALTAYDLAANLEEMATELSKLRTRLQENRP